MTDQPQEAERSAGGRALVSIARLPRAGEEARFEAVYADGHKREIYVPGFLVSCGLEWKEALFHAGVGGKR